MHYAEIEMEPHTEEHLTRERRRFRLDRANPDIQSMYQENLDFARRMKSMTDEEIAEELTLRMTRIAHSDHLTHLPNKHGLMVELKAAIETAKKFNLPLSVLFIDADHFKEINDTFGEEIGDQAIVATADGIRKGTGRWSDIEGRLVEETDQNLNNNGQATRRGGDEFVAILLETDREGAEVVARRIGEQVTLAVNQRLPLVREKLRRPFTVTIGMAQYHPDIDADENALLDRANQDLTLKRTARGESRRS